MTIQSLIAEAVSLHSGGCVDQAKVLYRQALEEEPDNIDALHMLGLLQFQQGEYPEARRLIERAVAINPRFAPALANYGIVLNVLGV